MSIQILVKYTLLPQPEYSRKKGKRLRKFNPRNDKIVIDVGAFGLDESSIVFAKNRRAYRESLRSDHNFIYYKKKVNLSIMRMAEKIVLEMVELLQFSRKKRN